MKKGFTMAEVLITLGVIGIVAALTLPGLIGRYQDKVLETQRQKAANILSNGYRKMLADTGLFEFNDLPLMACVENESGADFETCISSEHKKVFNIISDGIGCSLIIDDRSGRNSSQNTTCVNKIINMSSTYKNEYGSELPSPFNSDSYIFVTADGFAYAFHFGRYGEWYENDIAFVVYVDVNASKNPNEIGKDFIALIVKKDASVQDGDSFCKSIHNYNDIIWDYWDKMGCQSTLNP